MRPLYELDLTDGARTGRLTLELDRSNVFEDSPTAIVLTLYGVPYGADEEQAVTCGPLRFSIDIPDADAVTSLRLSEAAAVRDALSRLLDEAAT
jgi:hypothetical protein